MNKSNQEKNVVVTYQVSLLDDARILGSTQQGRLLSKSNQISLALKEKGLKVLNVELDRPEIEPDITMKEIIQLTGLSKSSIYHSKDIPVRRKGNKLYAKRSEILRWQEERV